VTVRVTSLRGAGAGEYYVSEVGAYYVAGEEPRGRWFGLAGARLGLSGEIDDEAFVSLLSSVDPSTGVPLGRAFGEKSVRGYDVTFSAPKSVSVPAAVADPATRAEVHAAHDAAVNAVLGCVERHALTRFRVEGEVVSVDAAGLAVGVFRRHVSREMDPQLHSHAVVAAKVRSLSRSQVEAIVAAHDTTTVTGRRNYAIVLVLARLGLRAAEVGALQLEDLDWRAGQLIVRGKARRDDSLPLPADVGEAIAAYLSDGRPETRCRAVFITRFAPLKGLAPGSVSTLVYQASRRAGIDPPVCSHRLRHALATDMLAAGVRLPTSARCFAIGTWPPRRSTPRSTTTRCASSLLPGRRRRRSRRRRHDRRLRASTP
jgi:hypothetical protein